MRFDKVQSGIEQGVLLPQVVLFYPLFRKSELLDRHSGGGKKERGNFGRNKRPNTRNNVWRES